MMSIVFNSFEKVGHNYLLNHGKFQLRALNSLLKMPQGNNTNQLSINSHNNSRLSMQINSQMHKTATASQVITRRGDTLEIRSQYAQQYNAQSQAKTVLNQASQQAVEGKVNGKNVALTTEKELNQVSNETRNTTGAENRTTTELVDKNTVKSGKTTVSTTHIDTDTEGNANVNSEYNRLTQTEQKAVTYDKNGKLVGSSYSNQAVTVAQLTNTAKTWESEGTRDITQISMVNENKEGDKVLRVTKNETIDVIQNSQVYNTDTEVNTATQVERFDVNGNLIGTSNSSQLTTSNNVRTVDNTRVATNEQKTESMTRKGETDVHTEGEYDINAVTVDRNVTTGTVQNFNGNGALVNQRNYENSVISTTVEDRDGKSNSHASTITKNGVTTVVNSIDSQEEAEVNTRIVSAQDGVTTSIRTIDTNSKVDTWGNLESVVAANGARTLNMEAGQVKTSDTEDLTVSANGQARKVETKTLSATAFDGELDFNPAAAATDVKTAAPGAMIIDLYSNTGIRANFKLDNGTLNFDFTAIRVTGSYQETTTGQINPKNDQIKNGTDTTQEKVTFEEIHFTGQITSEVDAEGNRVLSLSGTMTDQGMGALFVNNFEGFQSELSSAEMDINAKLTVNRQTTTTGNVTNSQYNATAEMDINRVENVEQDGVNVRNLTALNTSDGAKAGLIANNGALRFNFGVFNLGISFVA
jgi:hypothetical protein